MALEIVYVPQVVETAPIVGQVTRIHLKTLLQEKQVRLKTSLMVGLWEWFLIL